MIAPLFDDLIREARALVREAVPLPTQSWRDAGRQNLVLQSEMAYELGAGRLPAVSLFAATAGDEIPLGDEALLLGPDLCEMRDKGAYARIVLVRVESELWEDEAVLYNALTRIRNARYSVNPEGYMPRIDSSANREPIRVSRMALERGLSFAGVAGCYRDAYRRNREVLGTQQIFVTETGFDYTGLAEIADRCDQVLRALDHILKDFKMDCDSCGLQEICGEVEGLRELHFRK